MKQFFQKFFSSSENKRILIFAGFFALAWSIGWSLQEDQIDLKPALYALGFLIFVLTMSYIFRNNK